MLLIIFKWSHFGYFLKIEKLCTLFLNFSKKNFEKNISDARRTREIRKRGKKAVQKYEKEIEEICERLKKW